MTDIKTILAEAERVDELRSSDPDYSGSVGLELYTEYRRRCRELIVCVRETPLPAYVRELAAEVEMLRGADDNVVEMEFAVEGLRSQLAHAKDRIAELEAEVARLTGTEPA